MSGPVELEHTAPARSPHRSSVCYHWTITRPYDAVKLRLRREMAPRHRQVYCCHSLMTCHVTASRVLPCVVYFGTPFSSSAQIPINIFPPSTVSILHQSIDITSILLKYIYRYQLLRDRCGTRYHNGPRHRQLHCMRHKRSSSVSRHLFAKLSVPGGRSSIKV